MSDSTPPRTPPRPISSLNTTVIPNLDKMLSERCGVAEMYRMHAVWRCLACSFKTDCCGW